MSAIPIYVSKSSSKNTQISSEDEAIIEKVSKMQGSSKGMILVNDATHGGYINGNHRMYTDTSMKAKANTFIKPYFKPMLFNHDTYTQPSGRVMDSVYIKRDTEMPDGQSSNGFIKIGIWIPEIDRNKDCIDSIMSGLFLTTSVGMDVSSMKCSICGCDILSYIYGKTEDRCDHVSGQIYDEEVCYMKTDIKAYNEISIVNSPADAMAHITSYSINGEDSLESKVFMDSLGIPEGKRGEFSDFYKYHILDQSVGSTIGTYTVYDINYGKSSIVKPEIKQEENNMDLKDLELKLDKILEKVDKKSEPTIEPVESITIDSIIKVLLEKGYIVEPSTEDTKVVDPVEDIKKELSELKALVIALKTDNSTKQEVEVPVVTNPTQPVKTDATKFVIKKYIR